MSGMARSAEAGSATSSPSGFSAARDAAPLPRPFGRLLLLKLLARGGMGDVYLAATTGIEGAERPCVVKTVRRDHIHDGSFVARFLDEARVQSQLQHPGVTHVLEASTDENGEPFTVVEYVEGRSLADLRQRASQLGSRIGWPEAVAITIEMVQALAHVHERAGSDGTPLGIVHRDLSPQNVMVGYAGEVKLIDFGTARGHNRRCHTVAGVVFAKPGYVSPEIARQEVGDGRIDLYAVGVMLWELCASKRFLNGDPQLHLERVARGDMDLPPLSGLVGAPPLLDEIIEKLTHNDPDARFPTAASAVPELGAVLAMAPPVKNSERGVRARVSALMRALWPNEPSRCRAEFARLLRVAKKKEVEKQTPSSSRTEVIASQLTDDPMRLTGTPYRILSILGEGASGVVYEAEHVELERKVALKVLTHEHAHLEPSLDRFRREARSVAKLSHPNLVALHDFGRSLDGRVFLAMERLEGETLEKRLARDGVLPWRTAVKYAIDVTRALETAHAAGLVHRDIKPANLFVTTRGVVKLLDFGLATAFATQGRAKEDGFAVFGTPEYMAPEQAAGDPVDGRADIYALGAVLYELVTGTRVFEGSSNVEILGRQIRDTPKSPRAHETARTLPRSLEQLLLRTLAKAAKDRPQNAAALRAALSAILESPERRRETAKRAATWFGLAVVSTTLGIGIARNVSLVPERPAAPDVTPMARTSQPLPPSPSEPERTSEPSLPTADVAPHGPEPTVSPVAPTVVTTVAPVVVSSERELVEVRKEVRGKTNDPHLLRKWALTAKRTGDLRDAKRAGEMWMMKDGTLEPRMFLSGVLESSGHPGDAKAVLDEWLERHPESDPARKESARLGAKVALAKKEFARR
ncbi:MAG: serine/threonine-protein kinase [Polyangiaceae bacterium]